MGSSLWGPFQPSGGVQRLAAKVVTKKWDAHLDHRLNVLKWERLSLRRKKQKVMLCHRILRGGSIIPFNSFSPHPSPHIRQNHSFPLYCPNARTHAHQSSFLNSGIQLNLTLCQLNLLWLLSIGWKGLFLPLLSFVSSHSHFWIITVVT